MGIDHPLLLCWGCLTSLLVAPTSHPNPAFPLGAKQSSGFPIVCTFVQPSKASQLHPGPGSDLALIHSVRRCRKFTHCLPGRLSDSNILPIGLYIKVRLASGQDALGPMDAAGGCRVIPMRHRQPDLGTKADAAGCPELSPTCIWLRPTLRWKE
ncbi:hypothetical protein BDP55DRAFT_749108 [Colletotrichum godetiae]|uniref:Secreted protein n=1 Tax=Colletotrichum godetiae TaxID=1209918 RepID=A0AAJ0AKB7_9PEZI|nr:uncharacterized protein BDP55DRAFT_749108 [Colletotrichum godetiae]KAK1673306.1 hypothetical protein BDP55DRAFT_749108 [Colletotrichum godetiae]